MKQLAALQQQNRRTNSFRGGPSPLDGAVEGGKKSPVTIFWLVLHGICCLISLVLGFRFSRLLFFLLFSTSSSPLPPSATTFSALHTSSSSSEAATPPPKGNFSTGGGSRVVVGRHGILIRPWPHPDPAEVMKAHKIIERVQIEQRSLYGIKTPKPVIVITPTYVRTFQTLHLTGVMHSLMNVPYDLIWIVVEAGGVTNETASLISKAGLKTIHIGFDEKMPVLWEDRHKLESRMRLHALRVVREKTLDGIIMFADDSNMHSMELFDEIQNVKWVGSVSVGIITHSGGSEEREFPAVENNDDKTSELPVQGPACNSSNHFVGWHTLDMSQFADRSARYIGDRAVVLPRKLEWAGFILNARLVWEDTTDRPEWIKDLDEVGKDGEDLESPLSLLKDTSVVEPLGSCGCKVMLWWLRVEARADSKFPARYGEGRASFNLWSLCVSVLATQIPQKTGAKSRWIIDPPLEITVPAKRTPWPDSPPELPSLTEKVLGIQESIPENTERRAAKVGSRRKRTRSKKKHTTKVLNEHVTITRQSGDN